MSLPKYILPALGSVLVGVSVVLATGIKLEKRPNIVFIVVDTLRADSVSTRLGNVETPNIADLVATGISFPRAYAHAPMTLPSHVAMFSARQAFESGVYNNGDAIPAEVPMLAENLEGAGYQTAAVVSLATLWPLKKGEGVDRGFQIFNKGTEEVLSAEKMVPRFASTLDALDPEKPFFMFAHLSDPHEPYNEHAPWFEGPGEANRATITINDKELAEVTTSSMSWWEMDVLLSPGTHRLTFKSDATFKLRSFEAQSSGGTIDHKLKSGELMEPRSEVAIEVTNPATESRQVRLRAWICDAPSTGEIHSRYASEVSAADAAIGELIRELRERDLWDNTVIVLTADHGESLGEHGTIGHVVNLYDEMLHVPLVIRLPDDEKSAGLLTAQRSIARHIDIAPTLLEWLGLPNLSGASGESLLHSADRLLIAETHPPEAPRSLFALRDDKYKFIFDPE
ncbi:MAG: membrane-anchored protein YejM (alkaline phosphatase superfamily), partial [Planctomycetota bacterium]